MKFTLKIDKTKDEEVLVICKKISPIVEEIRNIVSNDSNQLIGYKDGEIKILLVNDIICFISENNKTYALTKDKRYLVKIRLYQIEELNNTNLIRINQSCIGNIKKISKFLSSYLGSIRVVFENGYEEYVARRELKNIKERLGIK